jgi:serralysin
MTNIYTGTAAVDVFWGTDDDDIFIGNGGDDFFYGNAGNDIFHNNPTTLVTAYGGAGDDTYILTYAMTFFEYANEGIDTIVTSFNHDLEVPGENEHFENITLIGVATEATGNFGANVLRGNSNSNVLVGHGGNDTLDGSFGVDTLLGGDNDDLLIGGSGGDNLDGGPGVDTAGYSTASALVVADLQMSAANTGDADDDIYTSIENLFGSAFGDTLRGNSGANYLKGEGGADTLAGRMGRDVLAGGLGSDRFLYNTVLESGTTEATRDVITDFVRGQDRINLSAIDAIAATGANDAFGLLAKGTSVSPVGTGKIGWYWLDYAGVVNDKTILRLNNDGDSYIDGTIELRGLITLAATDFNL